MTIKIVKRGKKKSITDKIHCDECATIFTCEESDCKKALYTYHGEVTWHIECPVCGDICEADFTMK